MLDPKSKEAVADLGFRVEELKVTNQEEWDAAAGLLRELVLGRKSLDEEYDSEIKEAHQAHKLARSKKVTFDRILIELESELRFRMSSFPARPTEGFGVRERVSFEVTDASLLSREFLTPNLPEIRRVVESLGMGTDIPGVEVVKTYGVAVLSLGDESEDLPQ